jgi:hypothetical protein
VLPNDKKQTHEKIYYSGKELPDRTLSLLTLFCFQNTYPLLV